MEKYKDLTKKELKEILQAKEDYILNLEQQNKEFEKYINRLRKSLEEKSESIRCLNRIICLKNSEIKRLSEDIKRKY